MSPWSNSFFAMKRSAPQQPDEVIEISSDDEPGSQLLSVHQPTSFAPGHNIAAVGAFFSTAVGASHTRRVRTMPARFVPSSVTAAVSSSGGTASSGAATRVAVAASAKAAGSGGAESPQSRRSPRTGARAGRASATAAASSSSSSSSASAASVPGSSSSRALARSPFRSAAALDPLGAPDEDGLDLYHSAMASLLRRPHVRGGAASGSAATGLGRASTRGSRGGLPPRSTRTRGGGGGGGGGGGDDGDGNFSEDDDDEYVPFGDALAHGSKSSARLVGGRAAANLAARNAAAAAAEENRALSRAVSLSNQVSDAGHTTRGARSGAHEAEGKATPVRRCAERGTRVKCVW